MSAIQVKEIEHLAKQLPRGEQLRLAQRLYTRIAEYGNKLIQSPPNTRKEYEPPQQMDTENKPNQTTLNLLAKWDSADECNSAQKADYNQEEVEQFLQNLNRNRREMEGSNARMLWH